MTRCTGLDCLPAMAASMLAPMAQQMVPSQYQSIPQCLLALNGLAQCAQCSSKALSVHHTRPGLLMSPASFP